MLAIQLYSTYARAYRDVMRHCIEAGGSTAISILLKGDDRLPFSLVGYSSDRWIKYTDAYLYGGKPFKEFLSTPVPRNSAATFIFGGRSAHSRGPCIISMTASSEFVHVNARTLHWANAAVLDLNLCWLLHRHYKRPVWLTCPRVAVLDWQLAGHQLLSELGNSKIVRTARAMRKNPEKLHWDRMQKKARRTFDHDNKDEEEIVLNFPRVTPEDVARHLRIKGTKLRNVLRAEFGYAIKGVERASHSWASYDDPRFIRVAEKLGIRVAKLPSVDMLAETRQSVMRYV